MTARKEELRANLEQVEIKISKVLESVGRNRDEVTLIVVTKTFPVSDAILLYDIGVRDFGENRDEEGFTKAPLLPSDARWHFQGQVQGRKIPSISSWANTVHSLDSLSHAAKFANSHNGKALEYFLQVNLEPDATHRGGVQPGEISTFLQESPVQISGLMVVAPLDSNPSTSSSAFDSVRELGFLHGLKNLSMGMSGDFEAALTAGATHIRVGSSILGSR